MAAFDMVSQLYFHKYNRTKPGQLVIDTKSVSDNDGAMVSIPAPGDGLVVAPFRIYATSTYAPTRGLNGVLGNTILEACDGKDVIISRHSADGNTELSSVSTPLLRVGDNQTNLDLGIEVAALTGVASLENTELRVWFDGKDADERQYILVNYKILKSAEVAIAVE